MWKLSFMGGGDSSIKDNAEQPLYILSNFSVIIIFLTIIHQQNVIILFVNTEVT